MPHIRSPIAGLSAILALFVLAPSAAAAGLPLPAAAQGAVAKTKQLGKHCAPLAGRDARGKCVAALSKLASGRSRSPSAACRSQSRKRSKGARKKSPFALCVSAGKRVLKERQRATRRSDAAGKAAGDLGEFAAGDDDPDADRPEDDQGAGGDRGDPDEDKTDDRNQDDPGVVPSDPVDPEEI